LHSILKIKDIKNALIAKGLRKNFENPNYLIRTKA